MFDLAFLITLASIVVIFYCLFLTISLKKKVPGGLIGKKWNFLIFLVILFTIGYMTYPFFKWIPEDLLRTIIAIISFFGAIYVAITIKLIFSIIEELTK